MDSPSSTGPQLMVLPSSPVVAEPMAQQPKPSALTGIPDLPSDRVITSGGVI